MEDNQTNSGNLPASAGEPVRSRWTPKPEQILILESIFESGMVNPAKEETVRIRKLLEKFGSVGDANVFYWFQNRRSRSRRRQRQIQASLAAASAVAGGGKTMEYEKSVAAPAAVAMASCSTSCTSSSSSSSSSSGGGGGAGFYYGASSSVNPSSMSSLAGFVGSYKADDLFSISQQMGAVGEDIYTGSYEAAQMQYQPGSITVFINGIPSEVPSGLINMRAMFGHDAMLIHSSGEPLPINEYGILLQSLQMGESYYLVRLKILHLPFEFKYCTHSFFKIKYPTLPSYLFVLDRLNSLYIS
ncbi:WUSCHEL-related homeobox 10 [Dendrobium catenatum]|uniref:WUSCHEL-related homeobox 10 n=1 Tax=Dendrobium catenatum TaxID=906689 RepID=A0A2I0XHP2_9ASPA|nr:WUSCHEL-related homeobox 10 [Dendrobium catenatum]